MKKLIALALVTMGVGLSARAQWVVYDPTMHVQQIIDTAQQIATTTTQLKAAAIDAEVQKLNGVLTGLSAALNNTDYELNRASASALVQDVANRNDRQRQLEARKEQVQAEFTEATH